MKGERKMKPFTKKASSRALRALSNLSLCATCLFGLSVIAAPITVLAKEPHEISSIGSGDIECQLTGDHQEFLVNMCDDANRTSNYGVYGTDMCSLFDDPSHGRMYVVFGDTFGADMEFDDEPNGIYSGGRFNRRPHVIASLENEDIALGTSRPLPFANNRWYGNNSGANGLVLLNPGDITAIPTSGWSNGHNHYLWVVHVNGWRPATSSGSMVWEFKKDFSPYASTGVPGRPTGYYFSANSKFALGTMLPVWHVNENAWYLYVYGTKMYRQGPVYLARTKVADLAAQDPTQVTRVFDGTFWRTPIWRRYDRRERDRHYTPVVDDRADGYEIGELSVIRNPHNGVFMMMYYRWQMDVPGDYRTLDASIMLRTAPNPWGPWSAPHEVADCSGITCYGSYMHPNLVVDNPDGTHSVYFIMSIMYEPGTGHLWGCQRHEGEFNNFDTNSPWRDPDLEPGEDSYRCNMTYNTFLSRVDIAW